MVESLKKAIQLLSSDLSFIRLDKEGYPGRRLEDGDAVYDLAKSIVLNHDGDLDDNIKAMSDAIEENLPCWDCDSEELDWARVEQDYDFRRKAIRKYNLRVYGPSYYER